MKCFMIYLYQMFVYDVLWYIYLHQVFVRPESSSVRAENVWISVRSVTMNMTAGIALTSSTVVRYNIIYRSPLIK